MKKIILFILVFLSLNLTSQTTDWVKSFGGDLADKGISIIIIWVMLINS